MFLEVFSNQYFWLSFLPIATLGGGFWLLYFDRADDIEEPLFFLFLALCAGMVSAGIFGFISAQFGLQNMIVKIVGEELIKILFAILTIEILRWRFRSVSQGIMYGFAVGLGFAVVENVLYLAGVHAMTEFSPEFWLAFQGRFWSTTLLHGVTTAIFGLMYAGAYLKTAMRSEHRESPLRAFFVPLSIRQVWYVLTLHVARRNLLFGSEKSLEGHYARAVVLEGVWLAILVHTIFNFALEKSFPSVAFILAFGGMLWLGRVSKKLVPG